MLQFTSVGIKVYHVISSCGFSLLNYLILLSLINKWVIHLQGLNCSVKKAKCIILWLIMT